MLLIYLSIYFKIDQKKKNTDQMESLKWNYHDETICAHYLHYEEARNLVNRQLIDYIFMVQKSHFQSSKNHPLHFNYK